MRKALLAVTVLFAVSLQAARADVNFGSAPADEYFGPYQQSVLEIRNRLNDYDKLDTLTMLDPSVGGYLDHLQVAIRAWQQKYPRDPWLPQILAHLMREYWRAGQASSSSGMAALAFMRSAYPDSPLTNATVALIYGSNASLTSVSRDDYAAPPQDAQPADVTAFDQAAAGDPGPSDFVSGPDEASPQDAVIPDDEVPTPPPTR